MAGELGGTTSQFVSGGSGSAASRSQSTGAFERQRQRLFLLQEYNRTLVTDTPDLAMELANSELSNDDMIKQSVDMLDSAQMTKQRQYYESMDDDLARGYWGQMTPGQRQALTRVGYKPPTEDDNEQDHRGSWLTSPGRTLGNVVGAPFKIGGLGLKALDWVGSQGSRIGGRIYRTGELLEERGYENAALDRGIEGLRESTMQMPGPHTFLSGGLVSAALHGDFGAMHKAWDDAEKGEYSVRQDARDKALEAFGGDQDMYDFAVDVSAGKSPEDILQDNGYSLDDPDAVDVHMQMMDAFAHPKWEEVQKILRRGKISIGRSAAEANGMDPNTGVGQVLSGSIDGSLYLTLDPSNLVFSGSVQKARRIKALGVSEYFIEHPEKLTQRIEQIEKGSKGKAWLSVGRDVRAAFNPADESMDFARLQRKHKHLVHMLGTMQNWHEAEVAAGREGFLTTDVAEQTLGDVFADNPEILEDMSDEEKASVATKGRDELDGWRDFFKSKGAVSDLINTRAGGAMPGMLMLPSMDRRQAVSAVGKQFFQTGWGSLLTGERGLDLVANHLNEVERGGKTVSTSKLRWRAASAPARIIQSFAKQQPFRTAGERIVMKLDHPEALEEFRKWLDGLSFANFSLAERDAAFNAFVGANPAERRRIIYSTYKDSLHYTGLLEDPAASVVLDDQLLGMRQAYGLDENGNVVSRGLDPDNHTANAVQLPSFSNFLDASKHMSLTRSMLQGTSANYASNLLNKYWKPAVVARPGFAIRAVSDELLGFLIREGPGAYLRTKVLEQNWANRGDVKWLANRRKNFDLVLANRMGLEDRAKFWAMVNNGEVDNLYELQMLKPVLWASNGLANYSMAKSGGALFGHMNRKLVDLSLASGGFFHSLAEMSHIPTKQALADLMTSTHIYDPITRTLTTRASGMKRLARRAEGHGWFEQAMAEDIVGGHHATGVEQAVDVSPSGRTQVITLRDPRGQNVEVELKADPSMFEISDKARTGTKNLYEPGTDINRHMLGMANETGQIYGSRPAMSVVQGVLAHNVSDSMAAELLNVPMIKKNVRYDELSKELKDLLDETVVHPTAVGVDPISGTAGWNAADFPGRPEFAALDPEQLDAAAEDLMTNDHVGFLRARGLDDETIAKYDRLKQFFPEGVDPANSPIDNVNLWDMVDKEPEITGTAATQVVSRARRAFHSLPASDRTILTEVTLGYDGVSEKILDRLSNQGQQWVEAFGRDGKLSDRTRFLLTNPDTEAPLTAKSVDELLPDITEQLMWRMGMPDMAPSLSTYDRAQVTDDGVPLARALPKDHGAVYVPLFDTAHGGATVLEDHSPTEVLDVLRRHLAEVDMPEAEREETAKLIASYISSPITGIPSEGQSHWMDDWVEAARGERAASEHPWMPLFDYGSTNDQLATAVGRTVSELTGRDHVLGRAVVHKEVLAKSLSEESVSTMLESLGATNGLHALGTRPGQTWEQAPHFSVGQEHLINAEAMTDMGHFVDVPEGARAVPIRAADVGPAAWQYLAREGLDLSNVRVLDAVLEDLGLAPGPLTGITDERVIGAYHKAMEDAQERANQYLHLDFEDLGNLSDKEKEVFTHLYGGTPDAFTDLQFLDRMRSMSDLLRSGARRTQSGLEKVKILDASERLDTYKHAQQAAADAGITLEDLPTVIKDGVTQSEVLRPSMELYAQQIARVLSSGGENPQLLHELIGPMLLGEFTPMDVARVPYTDLPQKLIAPTYVGHMDFGGWNGFVSKVFNNTITPFINAYMRTPSAWFHMGNALPLAEAHANAWLIDHRVQGDFEELINGARTPTNRIVRTDLSGEEAHWVNVLNPRKPYDDRRTIRIDEDAVHRSWAQAMEGKEHPYLKYMNIDTQKLAADLGEKRYRELVLAHEEGHDMLIPRMKGKGQGPLPNIPDADFHDHMAHEAAAELYGMKKIGVDPLEYVKEGMELNPGIYGDRIFEHSDGIGFLHGVNADEVRKRWRELPGHLKAPSARVTEVAEALGLTGSLNGEDIALIRRATENYDHANDQILEMTLNRAHSEVIQYMDDSRLRSYAQQYLDGYVPFLFAEEQFMKRMVRSLAQNPAAVRRGQLAMQGLKEIGTVQTDAYGNQVVVYPGQGAWQASVGRVASLFGMDFKQVLPLQMVGGVQNFSPGFDNLAAGRWGVGFSPLVSVALHGVTQYVPELRQVEDGVLGPQAKRDNLAEYFMPSWAVKLGNAFTMDMEGKKGQSLWLQAAAYMDYIDEDGSKGMGLPDNPTPQDLHDFKRRVSDASRILAISQATFAPFGPAPPRYMDPQNLKDASRTAEWDPDFLEYIQTYGIEEGLPKYLEHHRDVTGKDATPFTVFTTNRESGAPIAQTKDAYNFVGQHTDYMNSFRMAAPWLIPVSSSSDKFERKAYLQQLEFGLRERKSPDEWVNDLVFAQSAPEYFDLQDQYQTQLDALDPGPEKTALTDEWQAAQESMLSSNPLFKQMLSDRSGTNRREQVINEMWYVANDPDAPDAPALPALRDLIESYHYMTNVREALRNDRRAEARDRKAEILEHFKDWAFRYLREHPEGVAFYNSVLRPQLGDQDDLFTGSRVPR